VKIIGIGTNGQSELLQFLSSRDYEIKGTVELTPKNSNEPYTVGKWIFNNEHKGKLYQVQPYDFEMLGFKTQVEIDFHNEMFYLIAGERNYYMRGIVEKRIPAQGLFESIPERSLHEYFELIPERIGQKFVVDSVLDNFYLAEGIIESLINSRIQQDITKIMQGVYNETAKWWNVTFDERYTFENKVKIYQTI